MKIWVDADACPVVIKNILFKAAERTGVQLTLVANQVMSIPSSHCIKMIRVASGFDVADKEIVKRVRPTCGRPLNSSKTGTGSEA